MGAMFAIALMQSLAVGVVGIVLEPVVELLLDLTAVIALGDLRMSFTEAHRPIGGVTAQQRREAPAVRPFRRRHFKQVDVLRQPQNRAPIAGIVGMPVRQIIAGRFVKTH